MYSVKTPLWADVCKYVCMLISLFVVTYGATSIYTPFSGWELAHTANGSFSAKALIPGVNITLADSATIYVDPSHSRVLYSLGLGGTYWTLNNGTYIILPFTGTNNCYFTPLNYTLQVASYKNVTMSFNALRLSDNAFLIRLIDVYHGLAQDIASCGQDIANTLSVDPILGGVLGWSFTQYAPVQPGTTRFKFTGVITFSTVTLGTPSGGPFQLPSNCLAPSVVLDYCTSFVL
jgi:hypothetical protein